MLRIIWKSLHTGVVTTRYPDGPAEPPDGFRGAPVLRAGRRVDDLPPPSVCPSGAISASPGRYAIDLASCIFCGRCAGNGPQAPIEIGRDFELAARRRPDLIDGAGADGDGLIVIDEGTAGTAGDDQVAERIRRTLGRSLHLRHLDAGSCNACDWELTALLNPVYDVRRLGIDFVASPRHADGVIVTGPVTRNLEVAVRRTFEAVPEPRIVIAVGACACSGGIVGQSYASAGGVAEVLPVDVFIPGCPPRPQAIIYGILVALGRLQARRQRG
ncbi:MAG TPA: NADH-quinone oxidoreductase subunit NuoB [Kofleriaceae bacterium]|nr:NADH-quinone oxidoreductase subunit NuoB [Kofleriaceae bacterium]